VLASWLFTSRFVRGTSLRQEADRHSRFEELRPLLLAGPIYCLPSTQIAQRLRPQGPVTGTGAAGGRPGTVQARPRWRSRKVTRPSVCPRAAENATVGERPMSGCGRRTITTLGCLRRSGLAVLAGESTRMKRQQTPTYRYGYCGVLPERREAARPHTKSDRPVGLIRRLPVHSRPEPQPS
jgi:hypothetical protein